MPSINVDIHFFSHRKTMRLSSYLGDQAVTCLMRLWCYAAQHYPENGILGDLNDVELERIMGWQGERGLLVRTLIGVGFLDVIGTACHIHGWVEHARHLIVYKERAKKAATERWDRFKSLASSNASSIPQLTKSDSYASSNAQASLSMVSIHSNTIHSNTKKEKEVRAPSAKALRTQVDKRSALEEFTVTDEIRGWARVEFGVEIPDDIVEEFKDHWRKEPEKKLRTNWKATFQGNIRKLVGWGVLKPKALLKSTGITYDGAYHKKVVL